MTHTFLRPMRSAEDATPLIDALLANIDAARICPPDGIGKDAFIARVL